MDELVKFFKAFSDPTRLMILALLIWGKELCVCDLEGILELSQSKTSRHLRYLLNSGIVTDQRKDRWVYYSLDKNIDETKTIFIKAFKKIIKEDSWNSLHKKYVQWKNSAVNHCSIGD